jgi:hypothetical protein
LSFATKTASGTNQTRGVAFEKPCTLLYIDTPAAGTYAYTIKGSTTGLPSGVTRAGIFQAGIKFFAMEL